MAMINCPNCNQPISTAEVCVHCGEPIEKAKPLRHCKECDAVLEEGTMVCPNCGCPVEEKKQKNTFLQKLPKKMQKDPKKFVMVLAIAVIAFLAIVCGGISCVKHYQEKQILQQEEQYLQDMKDTRQAMIDGEEKADEVASLVRQVWYNAVWKKSSVETNSFTKPNGYFVNFNTALSNLYADEDYISDVAELTANQKHLETRMSELQTPPEKYKEAFSQLQKVYESYNTMLTLATEPTGTLLTYNSTLSDTRIDFASASNNLNAYLY